MKALSLKVRHEEYESKNHFSRQEKDSAGNGLRKIALFFFFSFFYLNHVRLSEAVRFPVVSSVSSASFLYSTVAIIALRNFAFSKSCS